ncbi:MAG: PPC domain-containing protein [Verrucomicrobiales bacterium]
MKLLIAAGNVALIGFAALSGTSLRAASPSLGSIMPRGAQRGTEAEFTLAGDRLKDVEEALLYTQGLAIKELKPSDDGKSIKAKVAIAPDCPLGEHYLRLRARNGLSEVKTFWVGQYPSTVEQEPNSDFAVPQKIPFNTTVEGVADNEDVDFYAIEAKKGQRLGVEVEGIRLNGSFWDPYVAILDTKRFELATADDTALLAQDGFAQIVAPVDGTYIVQVRDSSYVGNGGCRYRLHIGSFPRPAAVYPAGGKAGSEVELAFIGDKGGELKNKVALPKETLTRFPVFAESGGQVSPSPHWLRVGDLDNALEVEPNNEMAKATPAAQELPLAFNGILQNNGDVDWWKFAAKKDQKFAFIAHAKSIRSPLDPVLHIHNKDGGEIAGNDDAIGPDAKIDFTAPHEGDFFLRVHDHLNKGGADYVYRVEATVPVPSLTLSVPQFARYDFQSRQMMPVPKGNRMAALILGSRANFGGDLAFECPDLPAGVKLIADPLPQSSGGLYPIVFEAAADAPIGGKLIDLGARPIDEKLKHVRGGFQQQLDLMMGEPNNTPYYVSIIKKMAVAVVEEVPFKIDLDPPKVPLVHNGSMNLRVVATRKEGFKAAITVRMMWFPPNVGGQPTIQIPEGQNEAVYTINANASAEPRTWKIAVMGESDAGQGPILASSDLTPLTIAPPYLAMKIDMAAIEQGKTGVVICKLEHTKPFEGKAKITLQGLPVKAETQPKEITKDDKEIQFPITTAAETPAGQHKQLFCYLEIPEAGTVIPHNVGQSGVLRIDPPPPAPKNPAPMPVAQNNPPAPPAANKPEKQLSRLEKLRLEAQAGAK